MAYGVGVRRRQEHVQVAAHGYHDLQQELRGLRASRRHERLGDVSATAAHGHDVQGRHGGAGRARSSGRGQRPDRHDGRAGHGRDRRDNQRRARARRDGAEALRRGRGHRSKVHGVAGRGEARAPRNGGCRLHHGERRRQHRHQHHKGPPNHARRQRDHHGRGHEGGQATPRLRFGGRATVLQAVLQRRRRLSEGLPGNGHRNLQQARLRAQVGYPVG